MHQSQIDKQSKLYYDFLVSAHKDPRGLIAQLVRAHA